MNLNRRDFLKVGAAALLAVGCETKASGPAPDAPDGAVGPPPDASPAALDATPACGEETEENIEGPFYRAGAPDRANLVEAGVVGTPLALSGRLLARDCAPLPGGWIDLWQADGDGVYDNVGYRLRGRVRTDAEGRWAFQTVVPGNYPNGGTLRPRHLHVKVSASGHAPLTTQLYFAGDPHNAGDPWIRPSLIMTAVPDGAGGQAAAFDFVLARAR